MTRCCRLLVLIALLAAVGCEQGPRRYDVSGTVTYKGAPLPAGVIWFDPDVSKGADGPQGYAFIENGQFNTEATQSGSVGGPHLVRIEGFDGKPGEELPMGTPMFTNFTQPVDLPQETTTMNFDVPADAK